MLTCHSATPWKPSGFNFLTATFNPSPLIKPLYTLPKPPSPITLSALKFLVAALNSAKVNTLNFGAFKISPRGNSSPSLTPEAWLFSEPQKEVLVLFPEVWLLLLPCPNRLLVPPEWLLHPPEVELPFCISLVLLRPPENWVLPETSSQQNKLSCKVQKTMPRCLTSKYQIFHKPLLIPSNPLHVLNYTACENRECPGDDLNYTLLLFYYENLVDLCVWLKKLMTIACIYACN